MERTLVTDRWYFYDDETGMEYWHDGKATRSQCHDGVGLVRQVNQTIEDFLVTFPNATELEVR